MNDWRSQAACAGRDPRRWFAGPGVDPIGAGVAARICATCPVRVECATEAVRLVHDGGGELYGTWAGVWLSGTVGPIRQLEQLAGTDWPA